MRQKPVTIEVRKSGQHWAVLAEEQLLTQSVDEKGAQVLERTLRGLLRYTSRKLFRKAVSDALKGPKSAELPKAADSDESGHLFQSISDTIPILSDSCRSEATL